MDFITTEAIISYHRTMLGDRVRTEAYRRALMETVEPGDVVIDIGSGSGILAMFACQAGAARVYAIEQLRTADVAHTLIDANGLGDRITVVEEKSVTAELPEPADVLVTETLWNFGLGEGIGGFVIDARERLLRPGAAVIPRTVEMILAPVEAPDRYAEIEDSSSEWHGLDMTAFRGYAVNNVQRAMLDPGALVATPQPVAEIDLATATDPDCSGEAQFVTTRAGVIHGLGGWFSSELAPGVPLTNAPPNDTLWPHAFFPLERPLEVEAGTPLAAAIRSKENGAMWSWGLQVARGNGSSAAARMTQATLWGFPAGAREVGSPAIGPSMR